MLSKTTKMPSPCSCIWLGAFRRLPVAKSDALYVTRSVTVVWKTVQSRCYSTIHENGSPGLVSTFFT